MRCYILCFVLMSFGFKSISQRTDIVLICQDSTVTNPLVEEVSKYATTKKLVLKKRSEPKIKTRDSDRRGNTLSDLINNGLFTTLLYLTVGILLVVMCYVLVSQLKPKEVIEQRVVDLDNIEDIADLKVDEELDKALSNNDLRLAVRIQYLRVLQQLSEEEAIRWKPKKTNSVYVAEMRSHHLLGIFKMITRNYEYIWYGNRSVSLDLYQQWLPYFDRFFENQEYGK